MNLKKLIEFERKNGEELRRMQPELAFKNICESIAIQSYIQENELILDRKQFFIEKDGELEKAYVQFFEKEQGLRVELGVTEIVISWNN